MRRDLTVTEKARRSFGWLACLWFILLAILFTRPLITKIGSEAAGEIGDNIYFIWMIGWVKKALFKLGVNPMNVWFLNYPEGWNMAHTEITPAQLALAQLFAFIGSDTFAFNMTMLLSFVLSGLIMFGWVWHLTGSAAAGILSGTIFACLPYRQVHFLAGHLNLSGTQWLPLFFWGWFDLLRFSFLFNFFTGSGKNPCEARPDGGRGSGTDRADFTILLLHDGDHGRIPGIMGHFGPSKKDAEKQCFPEKHRAVHPLFPSAADPRRASVSAAF